MVKVEYLFPFNTKDGTCKDKNAFKALLSSNSNIKITDTKLKYKNSNYNYTLELDIVKNQDCSVFHITFSIPRTTDKFREMLKAIKIIVGKHLREDIQLIWDGISFEWSKELYPKIYNVENSLRKLISKFMLINLGIGWHESNVPKEVVRSVQKDSPKGLSILYQVDFIKLSDFLFKTYSIKDFDKLPNVIRKAFKDDLTKNKKDEILEYLPKNNWDRYFSDLVEVDSELLKKKWGKLYEIRCIVAHNKSMNLEQFNEAKSLIIFLEEKIKKAYENLSSIEIPEEEKESISLNTIATVNPPVKTFVDSYYSFNDGLVSTVKNNPNHFNGITIESSNPLNAILNSSLNGELNLSQPLKNNLDFISSTKDYILSGENLNNLNLNTKSNQVIFGKTSEQFISDFKIDSPNNVLSKLIVDGKQNSYGINYDTINNSYCRSCRKTYKSPPHTYSTKCPECSENDIKRYGIVIN